MSTRIANQKTIINPVIDDAWRTHDLIKLPVFSYVLPDGSTLNSIQNTHISTTIKKIAYLDACESPRNKVNVRLTTEMFALVQWMFLRKIFWFNHLTTSDIDAFFSDHMRGLDVTIQATPRIYQAILQSALSDEEGSLSTSQAVSDIFDTANIPNVYISKVPYATKLAREYLSGTIITNKKCPQPKQKLRRNSTGSLILNFLNRLYHQKIQCEDCLTVSPETTSARRILTRNGVPKGSTRTMPTVVITGIVAESIRWITELSPHFISAQTAITHVKDRGDAERRKEYVKQVKLLNESVKKLGYEFDIVGNATRPGQLALVNAYFIHLRAACFTVIASLTGRRWSEIKSLSSTSLTGSDEYGYNITTKIAKRTMMDTTPCPALVAQAIQTLIRVNKSFGNHATDFNIWNLPALNSPIAGKTKPLRQSHLQKFATFFELDKYQTSAGIQTWKFAPHQYRRLFACIYYWRWDDPSLIALSYYFRHVNMGMIRSYLNDPEMQRLFQEEGKSFTLEVVRRVATGESEGYGVYGKVLSRAIENMRTTTQVVDARHVETVITKVIEQRKLNLHPTPWGYCAAKASPSNLRKAACQQEGTAKRINIYDNAPDARASSEHLCATCHFHMTNESRRDHWLMKLESVQNAITAPDGSQMQSALAKQESILHRFVKNSFTKKDS